MYSYICALTYEVVTVKCMHMVRYSLYNYTIRSVCDGHVLLINLAYVIYVNSFSLFVVCYPCAIPNMPMWKGAFTQRRVLYTKD